MKQNELFNKCCENIDPKTREEVWKQMDKELRREENRGNSPKIPSNSPKNKLEQAAEEYADKHGFRVPYDGSDKYYDDVDVKASLEGFKAGAEWQKKQKPILEVFGFKVGDAVRLKDGDGRKHIIKSFEEVEGIHGPNFYHVEFEDNSARDGIYPGEEYPNGYHTQMEKFEEEQKPEWGEEDEAMRDNILRLLSCFVGTSECDSNPSLTTSYPAYQREIDWLKSLRPQPHWKSNEQKNKEI